MTMLRLVRNRLPWSASGGGSACTVSWRPAYRSDTRRAVRLAGPDRVVAVRADRAVVASARDRAPVRVLTRSPARMLPRAPSDTSRNDGRISCAASPPRRDREVRSSARARSARARSARAVSVRDDAVRDDSVRDDSARGASPSVCARG